MANFYNAFFGTEGIEKTVHVGPNAWAGLFAARFGNVTHDEEEVRVVDDARGEEAHVEVRQGDHDEARPGPLHVALVEHGQETPRAVPRPCRVAAREAVKAPANIARR